MKQEETYVGIDVAKDRLDVAIRPEGDIWSVDYDEQAVSELVSSLLAVEPTMVLLEATGGLEVPLVSSGSGGIAGGSGQSPSGARLRQGYRQTCQDRALDAQVLAHSPRLCAHPCAHCAMRTLRSSTH